MKLLNFKNSLNSKLIFYKLLGCLYLNQQKINCCKFFSLVNVMTLFYFQRQEMPSFTEEDGDDKEEEQPTVVVLKAGDLTAEEVELAKAQKQKGKILCL